MEDYETISTEIVTNGRDRFEIVLLRTPKGRHLIQITQTDLFKDETKNVVRIGAINLPGVVSVLESVLEKIKKPGKDLEVNDLTEKENAIIKQYLEDMVPISELSTRFSIKESEIVEMFNLRGISMAEAKYVPPFIHRRRRKK